MGKVIYKDKKEFNVPKVSQNYCDTISYYIDEVREYIINKCDYILDDSIDNIILALLKNYFEFYEEDKDLEDRVKTVRYEFKNLNEIHGLDVELSYTDCQIIGLKFKKYCIGRLNNINTEILETYKVILNKSLGIKGKS